MNRNIYKVIQEINITPFAIVFGIYILLIFFYIQPYQYNLSSLLKIDEQNANYRVELIPVGTVVFHGYGYDGQYNYYLAKDLIFKGTFTDAFRYQRILYPLLAKIISFGNDTWLFSSFIIINCLSVLIGMIYLNKLIWMNQVKGKQNSLLILYGLNLGFILGTLYDLGTPLAIGLIIIALYFYKREQIGICSLFLALSLLTMETAMLIIIPLMCYFILEKAYRKAGYLLISLVPWLIWQLILWQHFGLMPIFASAGVLTFPFYGMVKQLLSLFTQNYPTWIDLLRQTNIIWMILFVIANLIIGIPLFFKRKDIFSLFVTFQALFGVCLSQPMIWAHTITSPARVLSGIFPFLILLYGSDSTNRRVRFLFYFVWFLTGLGIIRIFLLPQYPYFIKGI